MAKKKLGLDDLGGFVFSTNSDFEFDSNEEAVVTLPPSEQLLEVHIERKQRAGKTATLIKGFVGTDDDIKDLGKELKTLCGVGGSTKEGEILIQGEFRDKIMIFLQKKGFKVKRVGG